MEATQKLAHSKQKINYLSLKGKTKQEVINTIGLLFNDINADVWMYRISYQASLFRKNYLYLYFVNNRVHGIESKRFKRG
tara:strand:+ start:862 stop:1101 length:240 start_codon:yes stop_codon:yes gene_type:complete